MAELLSYDDLVELTELLLTELKSRRKGELISDLVKESNKIKESKKDKLTAIQDRIAAMKTGG